MLGTSEKIPMDERVCRAVAMVHKQIKESAMPELPLFWTEWNVQGMNESRDTPFVGPGVANTVRQCDGLVDMMSFWTFSDVFEEGGPIPRPFEGEFGLRAAGGINKPSYYDFALLHKLGSERLKSDSDSVLVTKDADGTLRVAAWNLVDPDQQGKAKTMTLKFAGVPADAAVTLERVDENHGNPMPAYVAMGRPQYPTEKQVAEMNTASALGPAEKTKLKDGKLELNLGVNALVLVTVGK